MLDVDITMHMQKRHSQSCKAKQRKVAPLDRRVRGGERSRGTDLNGRGAEALEAEIYLLSEQ